MSTTYEGLGGRFDGDSRIDWGSLSGYLDVFETTTGRLVVHECGTFPTSLITRLILLFVFSICTASS